jgi:hypothetical protein
LALSLAALPACNPYQNFSGEYYAGPVDGTSFPAAYQGALPGPADQGGGTIAGAMAWSKNSQIVYYNFPFTDDQNGQADPLALDSTVLTIQKAYVFDADAPTNAFPAAKCTGPKNYLFDQRTEAWRADEQGVVFSAVPSAGYIPVVAEDPETMAGRACQSIKSKQTLLADMKDPGPDANFLAFAIIDPTADVTPHTNLGLGPIHEGWYNHYLVVFLDGGYIPVNMVTPAMGGDPYPQMQAQTLYTPTQIPGMDASGTAVPVAGMLGAGFDLLDAARGTTGYSPVCDVKTFVPDDPLNPKHSIADLSAAELASTNSADADQGFIFCFQP